MSTIFKSGLSAVAAAVLLCLPAWSQAAMAPAESPQASSFFEQALKAAPPAYALDGKPRSEIPPPGTASRKPFALELRGHSDLALWNLIATVRAQQKNQVFELVDVGATIVREIEREQVSAVPLPGALWLFVMGLTGLAANRRKKKAVRERQPWGATAAA